MDAINYSNFNASGVVVSDTFDIWRQKTNGTIEKLNSIVNSIDLLYNESKTDIRYVTTDTVQSIVSTKTFKGGSKNLPVLKIDSAGLYYDSNDSSIASTHSLKSEKIINSGSSIQLGSISYKVPTNNPTSQSILSKSGENLQWTEYSSLISQLGSDVSINVVTTNMVLPVGTIHAYGSDTNIPQGWLSCNGQRFLGSDYPELAALLLNKYGDVYTSETGTRVASTQDRYVANNWYTLPDLRGRIALGSGTGNDGVNAAQTFGLTRLTSYGGKYFHNLTVGELPSHSHVMQSSGDHVHSINLQSTTRYDSLITFGDSDTGGLEVTTNNSTVADNTNINIVSSGAHIHTINSTGSSLPHTIVQPYTVTHYIIKATPDNVISSQIKVGSGINVTRGGAQQTYIALADDSDSTISVKHDSTLRIDSVNNALGLNVNSVNTSNIVNAAVSAEKLSAYGPSWGLESGESALYEGSGSSRKRVATREWISNIIIDGAIQSLSSKSTNSRHTSAAVEYKNTVYAYIDKDGIPCMTGYHSQSALAASDVAGGYTPYPLPLDEGYEVKAVKLYIHDLYILALGSNGKLYARGKNQSNVFNISSYTSDASYSNWVLAFDSVYSHLQQNRKIVSVITNFDVNSCNIAVIDDKKALWIAGENSCGQLANGTTIATGKKASLYKFENNPVLTNVKEAIITGSWNGNDHVVTVAAIQWSNDIQSVATIKTVGYGEYGQIGNGTNIKINSEWKTVSMPSGIDITSGELYSNGSTGFTSLFVLCDLGYSLYAWGFNGDLNFGVTTQNNTNVVPFKVWDASTTGLPFQRDRIIEKLYTGVVAGENSSSYILTAPVEGKREIWAAGTNFNNKWGISSTSSEKRIWTNITPLNRPANWKIEDFYVGQSFDKSSNSFIKWKIETDDVNSYQLEAAGWSGDYNTGTGLNHTPLSSWTRVNLRGETVKKIVDIQNGRSVEGNRSYSYLLCNDGSLYFSGMTHYQCNPHGIEGYATPNFIRIK